MAFLSILAIGEGFLENAKDGAVLELSIYVGERVQNIELHPRRLSGGLSGKLPSFPVALVRMKAWIFNGQGQKVFFTLFTLAL